RLVRAPAAAGGAGGLYAPGRAWRGSLTPNGLGRPWLNSLTTFEAPAYAVIDGSLGYRFQRLTAAILASNLGDRRDAVQLSELGEGQFYRLPARPGGAAATRPSKEGWRVLQVARGRRGPRPYL